MTTTVQPEGVSTAGRWRWLVALVVVFGLAVVIRVVLLPTDGLRGDIDQFVLWAHNLVAKPFGNAYDQDITFPPVMVYIWGALATLVADFQTVTTGADPAIRGRADSDRLRGFWGICPPGLRQRHATSR